MTAVLIPVIDFKKNVISVHSFFKENLIKWDIHFGLFSAVD